MSVYIVRTTGNLLADALCSLGLFELSLAVDPLATVEFCLGRSEVLKIKTRLAKQDFERGLFDKLEELAESEKVQRNLNFQINVGGKKEGESRKKASEVLHDVVNHISIARKLSEEAFQSIVKLQVRRKDLITCYFSVLPIYGKGLKAYDADMKSVSARTTHEILATYLIGLAFYTLSWNEEEEHIDKRIHLVMVPPYKVVDHGYLLTIRRLALLYSTEDFYDYKNYLDGLPRLALPLALLAKFDFSLLTALTDIPPQIIVFNIEGKIKGGVGGEASRLYKLYDTTSVFKFLESLGEYTHDFKEYIVSLIQSRRNKEVQRMVDSILIQLVLAINNHNPNMLNMALFESLSLRNIVNNYLIKPETAERAMRTLVFPSNSRRLATS